MQRSSFPPCGIQVRNRENGSWPHAPQDPPGAALSSNPLGEFFVLRTGRSASSRHSAAGCRPWFALYQGPGPQGRPSAVLGRVRAGRVLFRQAAVELCSGPLQDRVLGWVRLASIPPLPVAAPLAAEAVWCPITPLNRYTMRASSSRRRRAVPKRCSVAAGANYARIPAWRRRGVDWSRLPRSPYSAARCRVM
jgi:hypothetical protein